MSNSNKFATVGNVYALDSLRRGQYPTTLEISGKTVNLKNATGNIIATGTTQDTTYEAATTAKDGLMASGDKAKLNGLENYTLPQATDSTLGGVMLTSSLTSESTTVALTAAAGKALSEAIADGAHTMELSGTTLTLKDGDSNTLSTVTIPAAYTLPAATASALGGVKAGTGVNIAADGTLSVSLPSNPLTIKGTVAATSNLPTSGNSEGDMYLVGASAPYSEYFWTGSAWELFGTISSDIDTSKLVTTDDVLNDDDFLAGVTA